MRRHHANPLDTTILHLRIRVQPLGHSLGDDGALVLLQRADLGLDVCGESVDFSAFGIEVGYNMFLRG